MFNAIDVKEGQIGLTIWNENFGNTGIITSHIISKLIVKNIHKPNVFYSSLKLIKINLKQDFVL